MALRRLTANHAVTTTTLADVTGLSHAVTAGTYEVLVLGAYTHTTASAPGFGFTGPTATSVMVNVTAGTTINGTVSGTVITALATAGTVTDVGTAATNRLLRVQGVIVFSASGTLQLQAQRASGTMNIIANTTLRLRKVL